MSRGLRLLPAVGPLPDRRRRPEAHVDSRDCHRRPEGARQRRDPFLSRRGLALTHRSPGRPGGRCHRLRVRTRIAAQAETLGRAGLDYYNHNLDTSPEYYSQIITTRAYQDRLETLANVRAGGVRVCCGGIVGMGETRSDRAGLLAQLANLDPHPESVPINLLVQVPGTPLHGSPVLDGLELVRTVAAARLMMPDSVVRLSAGRNEMSDELQALCLHAGANSLFLGERLLTTGNPGDRHDRDLLDRLDSRLAPAPLLESRP